MLLGSLILILFGIAPLMGQTNYSKRKATRNYSVGVGLAGGAAMIISPPDGLKVGPLLATRFGVDVSIPVSGTVTPMLSLGLDSRGTELHAESNSDAYTLTEDFRIVPSGSRKMRQFNITLDNRYYKYVSDLDERFPHGVPSLAKNKSLVIEGDFIFGKDVVCQGDVHLRNESGQPIRIPDGTVLTGSLHYA